MIAGVVVVVITAICIYGVSVAWAPKPTDTGTGIVEALAKVAIGVLGLVVLIIAGGVSFTPPPSSSAD